MLRPGGVLKPNALGGALDAGNREAAVRAGQAAVIRLPNLKAIDGGVHVLSNEWWVWRAALDCLIVAYQALPVNPQPAPCLTLGNILCCFLLLGLARPRRLPGF